jgi:hypothetical protein
MTPVANRLQTGRKLDWVLDWVLEWVLDCAPIRDTGYWANRRFQGGLISGWPAVGIREDPTTFASDPA